MRSRTLLASLAVFLVGGLAVAGALLCGAKPPTGAVIFIVLDTVRADHASLCGYSRPTTPTLQGLVQDGAKVNCDVWAPASWTLPSHASYFTGVGPEVHGAHSIVSGIKSWEGSQTRARKLDKKLPTLAESMVDRGYQALAVSANPVVSKNLGLMRGFEASVVSPRWGKLMDEELPDAVAEILANERDSTRPLFLFVNISDAHQPWKPVPRGALGDADAQPRLDYARSKESDPWRRFVAGTMPPEEMEIYAAGARDSYDYGVWRADHNVQQLLETLDEQGVCDEGCRFVLTSDHGEFLGEHGLLDHGNYVYESMVRVPIMTWGWDGPDLDGVKSALVAHGLVLNGLLSQDPLPMRAWAWPHARRCKMSNGRAFCNMSVAVRDGDQKLVWEDRTVFAIDLASDPQERNRLPLPEDDPRRPELERLGQIVLDEAADDDVDPDVTEALRAAGYLE
jgi:arylsulfatase A-like enzyme